ncbi:MAG: FAD-binding oxidoreductase [Nitrospirota bacterium]
MEAREFETKVIAIIPRTHDIKSFRFAVSEDTDFKPGQFFRVTIRIKGQETTKHFSFSNSPHREGICGVYKKDNKQ